ncbi:hypothetical protein [Desertibaculum subflavum]|uniref:hypothetical protein n=1 Tax=Desertibaculum subflavum TaxID=2268458 RepID=UPI0013C42BE5
MTKLFLLTIAAGATILLIGGLIAIILFRRETRRAEFGRAPEQFRDGRHHRRLVF